ncbi:MAG: hypothetical protein JRG91_01090 [Deltaproteobacteria bacterium]|nr:hypothetical protein [Deltaproteobacteria bacterium]
MPAVLIALCVGVVACKAGRKEVPERPWKAADGAAGSILQSAGVPDGQPTRSATPLGGKLRTPYTLKAGRKASVALYALEGEAVTPSWAAPGSDPAAARDDDLRTSWSCSRIDEARPCAISLVLPEEAEVHVIRIFPGAGASHEEFKAHARPKVIRVHTDAGWAEARIKRGWDHRHILLPAGIVTRTVTLEIAKTRPGRSDSIVHAAEIELFGITGKARGPLEIEPRAATVHLDGAAWKTGDEESISIAAPGFIELVDGNGGRRRLLRGTGLMGETGDRFFLVENLTAADCPAGGPVTVSGSFTLVDTKTRIFWDVGGLGGVLEPVFRHPEGIGFATAGWNGTGRAAAVLVEGHMFRMPADREGAFTSDADLAAWGFTESARPCCASVDESQWTKSCAPASGSKARKMLGALEGPDWDAFWKLAGEEDWLSCPLEAKARMLVFRGQGCTATASVLATIDAKGGIADWRMASRFRLGASFSSRGLVEAVAGGGSSILRIGPDGKIEELHANAALSLILPPSCTCAPP